MAWLWIVSLVLAFLVGFAARGTGRWGGRVASPEPPRAVCLCSHEVSFHEGGRGVCREEVSRNRYNRIGDWVGEDWVACACQVYAGPELVSSVTLQPVVFREVTSGVPDERPELR